MSCLKDLLTGQRDAVLMMFIIGFAVACVKLLFSGNTIGPITLSAFNSADFAVVVGALGGIYTARKHSDNITKGKSNDKNAS